MSVHINDELERRISFISAIDLGLTVFLLGFAFYMPALAAHTHKTNCSIFSTRPIYSSSFVSTFYISIDDTILEWFHLKKKCMELLIMAINGKEKRNAVVEKLLRHLWFGDVDRAAVYLKSLTQPYIKNQNRLE